MSATPVDNGVNVEALLEAREVLSDAPRAAKLEWRASCTWVNGTHGNSTVQGFFGLGEEQSHKTEFSFSAGHPEIFASEDNGAAGDASDLAEHLRSFLDNGSRGAASST